MNERRRKQALFQHSSSFFLSFPLSLLIFSRGLIKSLVIFFLLLSSLSPFLSFFLFSLFLSSTLRKNIFLTFSQLFFASHHFPSSQFSLPSFSSFLFLFISLSLSHFSLSLPFSCNKKFLRTFFSTLVFFCYPIP